MEFDKYNADKSENLADIFNTAKPSDNASGLMLDQSQQDIRGGVVILRLSAYTDVSTICLFNFLIVP